MNCQDCGHRTPDNLCTHCENQRAIVNCTNHNQYRLQASCGCGHETRQAFCGYWQAVKELRVIAGKHGSHDGFTCHLDAKGEIESWEVLSKVRTWDTARSKEFWDRQMREIVKSWGRSGNELEA